MPNNTDYSGSARAAKLRRIAAGKGPVGILPVRPNIGSMALDAKFGRAECCVYCDQTVEWTSSSDKGRIVLSESRDSFNNWVYSAIYATVSSSIPYEPLFGQLDPPPPDAAETRVKQNGNVWTVQFVFSSEQQELNFSQATAFKFDCTPPVMSENTMYYTIE
jgi:hypothetical protein